MPDKEFIQQLAREIVEEQLKYGLVSLKEDQKQGIQAEFLNLKAAGAYMSSTANAVRHLIREGKIKPYRDGNRLWVKKSDLNEWMLSKAEWASDRIRDHKEGKGPKDEEDDIWEQLVSMFYDYLPPVPRSAFPDAAAHEFYKKYRQEMLMEACIDPFGDTMSKVMDEIKDAVTEANREEKEIASKGVPLTDIADNNDGKK